MVARQHAGLRNSLIRRVSTVVVQQFCKLLVGGSNPSPGTNFQRVTSASLPTLSPFLVALVAQWWPELGANGPSTSRGLNHIVFSIVVRIARGCPIFCLCSAISLSGSRTDAPIVFKSPYRHRPTTTAESNKLRTYL